MTSLYMLTLVIGKFAGLVRVPAGDSYQEMIRLVYQHNDIVDVSIHSLYKISKYRRGDSGEAPRLSVLGSGAWDRLKERAKKESKTLHVTSSSCMLSGEKRKVLPSLLTPLCNMNWRLRSFMRTLLTK